MQGESDEVAAKKTSYDYLRTTSSYIGRSFAESPTRNLYSYLEAAFIDSTDTSADGCPCDGCCTPVPPDLLEPSLATCGFDRERESVCDKSESLSVRSSSALPR